VIIAPSSARNLRIKSSVAHAWSNLVSQRQVYRSKFCFYFVAFQQPIKFNTLMTWDSFILLLSFDFPFAANFMSLDYYSVLEAEEILSED
jgi:hypothetical protein